MNESASSSGAEHTWVTVLAGGIGSRFWPASTPRRPKQLLRLASDRPLIVDTVERGRGLVEDARLRILTGHHMVPAFQRVLTDLPDSAYMVEPRARGTAPVLAWAAHDLLAVDPDAVLVSLHADHLVRPEAAFSSLIRAAAELAERERVLVTVGAVPDRPETGYGYIQPGDPVGPTPGSFRVGAFHEKPALHVAERYVAEGFLWNTGMFVWRADIFLEEVRAHAPEIGRHLARLDEGDVAGFFDACPNLTVDVGVLERSRRVACVRSTFTWDDVGGWEALARGLPADEHGNVRVGDAVTVEASGNVVYAEDAPVVLFGVDGLVVVRTAGMTLVVPRERAAELKMLLARLPERLHDPETS